MTNDDHLLTPFGAALARGQRVRLDTYDIDEIPNLEMPPPSAPPYRGANPFKRGPGFNLTEQFRLQRESPELAAALRADAGI
jgi:hypothetical protein